MISMSTGESAQVIAAEEISRDNQNLPPFSPYSGAPDLLAWMDRSRQQYGDIFATTLYGRTVYVVCSPQHANHVLRLNYQNYRKGLAIKRVELLLGKGLMVSEGALWKRQRQMIQPAFQPKNLHRYLEVIEAANARLKRRWLAAADAGHSVNVTHDVSSMTLEIVLETLFGEDCAVISKDFTLVSEDKDRDLAFAQKFRSLSSLILDLRKSRTQSGRDHSDLLGMLMCARDRETGEPMSDAQLVNEVLTLIVAGHETTAGTLAWAWYLLSQHLDDWDRLESEVGHRDGPLTIEKMAAFPYTRRVIEETMRLYPPGWLMTRRALADDEIGGYFVPRGAEIYIPIYIIQRHPAFWQEPDVFKPDRFLAAPRPGSQIPFSAGPRNCIAEHLARLEMLVHFVSMAGSLGMRFPDPPPLAYELGVNLRSRDDFVMYPQRSK